MYGVCTEYVRSYVYDFAETGNVVRPNIEYCPWEGVFWPGHCMSRGVSVLRRPKDFRSEADATLGLWTLQIQKLEIRLRKLNASCRE